MVFPGRPYRSMRTRVAGHRPSFFLPCYGGVALLGLVVAPVTASAQVAFDGKFGTTGVLTGPDITIPSDAGSIRGGNLFHSFSRFDLGSGDTATFQGPAGIRNILGRVTSGAPSNIDGTIRSAVPGANLFLINPAGLIFGPNAVVDVSGSFAAASANYLRLADGARFVAALDADDSVLSSEPLEAFGFLDGAGGSVEVRGRWNSGPGQSLAAVGTTVSVMDSARLEAPGGSVRLTGGAAGEVPWSGSTAAAGPGPTPGGAAGAPTGVLIRGGRLVVDQALVQENAGQGIRLEATESVEVIRGGQVATMGADGFRGGDVVVEAPQVVVDGQDVPMPTRLAAETMSGLSEDAGGNVVVRADSLAIRYGGEISVSAMAMGSAGRVEIDAGTVHLVGSEFPMFPTQISANAAPITGVEGGAGGGIGIRAGSLEIDGGAAIMASAFGDSPAGEVNVRAGTVQIRAGAITTFAAGAGAGGSVRVEADSVLLDGPFSTFSALTTGMNGERPAGAGGQIDIQAGVLRLQNDAGISATTFGDGRGGGVRVQAARVELEGASGTPGALPGIAAGSQPSFFGDVGSGPGGDVDVIAGSLTLRGGMSISTSTATPGNGGSVRVQAGAVSLSGASSIQSASTGSGSAGTVDLRATGDVHLTGGSSVGTSALDSSGGDILVRSGGTIRLDSSLVTSQAGPGGGGNITVAAPDMIYLLDSRFTAQAVGDGGNLTIEPQFLVLNRSGLISKSSTANGGNITLDSGYFLRSDSIIDASAPFGLPGTVTVTAPDVDLIGSLVDLPSSLLGLETLLRPDCGVRLGGGISSLIVLPRGGLPLDPAGFLPSGSIALPDEKR